MSKRPCPAAAAALLLAAACQHAPAPIATAPAAVPAVLPAPQPAPTDAAPVIEPLPPPPPVLPPAPGGETAAAADAAQPATPVLLLVRVSGDGWTPAMRQRAEDMLRLRLGSDARLQLLPAARVEALGARAEAKDLLSAAWLQSVADDVADLGDRLLLVAATLHLEQQNVVDAEGRPQKAAKLTVGLQWSDRGGSHRGDRCSSGHLLANDQVIAAAATALQAAVLPAQ